MTARGNVHSWCTGAHVDQKRALDIVELVLQAPVSHLIRILEIKLGPLQEQKLLLIAEPSFQSSY